MSNVITFEEFEEMYKKHGPSDNLTLLDILEIIKYSVDYIEFMITYNELIPDIVKAKKEADEIARAAAAETGLCCPRPHPQPGQTRR